MKIDMHHESRDQRGIKMPTAAVRNGGIYYEENGSGEPIVLMPGLGHGAAYFEKTVPLLSGLGRTVAIDPRAVGRSTSHAERDHRAARPRSLSDHRSPTGC